MNFKRDIKFIEGNLIYQKNQFILFPIMPFILLESEIFKDEKNILLIEEKLKEFILKIAFQLKKEKKLNLKSFIEFLNELGFGIISFNELKNNSEIYIKIENSKYAKLYFKKIDNKSEIFILKIILETFFKMNYNKNIESKIIFKNYNIYFKFKGNFESDSNFSNEKINLKNENKLKKSSFKLNSLIKRVLINNQIKIIRRNISLWGVDMILLPKLIFDLKIENDKIILKIIEIGIAQGIGAYNLLKNLYGENNNSKIIKSLSYQSNLLGFGIIKIYENDLINQKLILEFSKDFFVGNELNLIGIYSIGITIGALESIYMKKFFYEINKNKIKFYSNNNEIKYSLNLKKLIGKLNLNSKISF